MENKKIELPDDKALAEDFVFPHELKEAEKAAADAELKRLRIHRLAQMSEKQKIYAELLRLRYLMEDYLRYGTYEDSRSFGAFLKKYQQITGRTQKALATEISLHPSKLNQILNNKIEAGIAMHYRLEKHSGGLIPASLWWKIQAKKIEAGINQDKEARQRESRKVSQAMAFN